MAGLAPFQEKGEGVNELEKRYLSVKGLCEYLDFKPSQVYWLVFKRKIPFTKLNGVRNGRLRFPIIEIDKWLAEKTVSLKDIHHLKDKG